MYLYSINNIKYLIKKLNGGKTQFILASIKCYIVKMLINFLVREIN